MAITVGLLIIHYHNNWVNNWTVLVTIFGWIALVKGILLLAVPKLSTIFKALHKSENIYKYIAPVAIILGVVFGYFGFFS